MRRSAAAAVRRLSTQRPDAGAAGLPKQPPAASSAPSSSPSSSAASESSGPGVGTLLALTALSAPTGVAVYLKQNPEWNPESLRTDPNWIKFRELVLGESAKPSKLVSEKQIVVAKPATAPVKPKQLNKSADELSALISSANPDAALPPKTAADVKAKTAAQVEVKDVVEAAPVAETKPEPKAVAKKEVEQKPTQAVAAAVAEPVAEKKVGEKPLLVKKVDAAVAKAREEIDALAQETAPAVLGSKIEKQIQSTTKEIVDTLQAETAEAAFDVDKNYLSGIHELDANSLAIRVAQLATEMKHRSKWEAVRLLEALRRMEEDAKKKGAKILERQQNLHKELLERELRLQHETLTRATREEMEALKKQYAEDLARTVQAEKTGILKSLQEKFAVDKQAIEDKYALQLKTKSETFQETLTKERKQRVEELENYRAQLRALNAVLERTSTYEAFSHQVHKASMAALALSDRIEAAMPLRTEIRALRDFARNDPLIDAALKTLPNRVIEDGAASVSQLQERFKTVKSVGRRAAMVPEGSGLMGQLFGGALSYLIIPPGGPIEGDEPEAVLSRADYALKAGDIEKAVSEMKALKGFPAEIARDWITAAEDRLAVEQTAKIVKAHISLLAASCS